MAALLREAEDFPAAPPPVIALLRLSMLDCRVARRGSLQACRVLDPAADASDFARSLALALPDMTTRRPVFWRPGTHGLSFDEAWLDALLAAIDRGDPDSERFLMTRRVRPAARPVLAMLLRGLSERLAAA